MKKLNGISYLFIGFLFTSFTHATIIDNGDYTSDTSLGLDYLDVGLVHGNYSDFQSGIVYDGRTWTLATSSQLASTWSDATGLSLTVSDIFSSDNDMGATATGILVDLFDGVTTDTGVTGEIVIGDYNTSGYYNFIDSGQLAVHLQYDDSHYISSTSGFHGAWLVSTMASVPEPGALALISFGLAGLYASRKKQSQHTVA